jgi:PAS domain-containing protein
MTLQTEETYGSLLENALEQRRRTGRFAGVLNLVRKDGTRFLAELSSAIFKDPTGEQRTSMFIRDITERERMVGELHDARAKARQLGGLLPICASCKKIRNDEGYWQDVAVYIREHSEADFSHGICPDCMHLLYPDLL